VTVYVEARLAGEKLRAERISEPNPM
jgi:hypothetical protein